LLEHGNWVIGMLLQASVLVLRRVAEDECVLVGGPVVKPAGERGDSSEAGAGKGAVSERGTRRVEAAGLEAGGVGDLIRAHPLSGVGVSRGGGAAANINGCGALAKFW